MIEIDRTFRSGYYSQMKRASLTETKNRLSALIDEVRGGETILVLDRGRPVARIESVTGGGRGAPGRLDRLERKGLVTRGRGPGPAEVLARRPPRPKSGASAVEALIAERSGGR